MFHRAKSTPDTPFELVNNIPTTKPFAPRYERKLVTTKKTKYPSKSRNSKKKDDRKKNNKRPSRKKRESQRTRSCTNLNYSKQKSSKRSSLFKSKKRYSSIPSPSDNNILPSEPCYVIQAHFKNNILAIHVNDCSSTNEWRQEFTQNVFKHIQIYKVSKILIRSIQKTAQIKDKDNNNKKKNDSNCKKIKIFEYNGLCYVTLIDSGLPSFALRPIDKDAGNISELKEETEPNKESHGSMSPPIDPTELMMQKPSSLHGVIVNNMIQNIIKTKLPVIIDDNGRNQNSTKTTNCAAAHHHKIYNRRHYDPAMYNSIHQNKSQRSDMNKDINKDKEKANKELIYTQQQCQQYQYHHNMLHSVQSQSALFQSIIFNE